MSGSVARTSIIDNVVTVVVYAVARLFGIGVATGVEVVAVAAVGRGSGGSLTGHHAGTRLSSTVAVGVWKPRHGVFGGWLVDGAVAVVVDAVSHLDGARMCCGVVVVAVGSHGRAVSVVVVDGQHRSIDYFGPGVGDHWSTRTQPQGGQCPPHPSVSPRLAPSRPSGGTDRARRTMRAISAAERGGTPGRVIHILGDPPAQLAVVPSSSRGRTSSRRPSRRSPTL